MKHLIVSLFIIIIIGCSKDYVGNSETGGGTETVIGKIVDSVGVPVEGVIVKLISQDYSPVDMPDSSLIKIDTTDDAGIYSFNSINSDTYNLFGYLKNSLKSVAKRMIKIDNQSYYTFCDSLLNSGTIKIILPDTTSLLNRKVYIPGTDIVEDLSNASFLDSSNLNLFVSNVPPSLYSSILMTLNIEDSTLSISEEIEIFSNDTAVVSTYLKWEVLNTINSELPCNIVFDMAIEDNDIHWYATDAGVAKRVGDSWEFYNAFNSGLPSNFVYSIAISSDGTKWFGTRSGLVKFKNNVWDIYKDTDSKLPDNFIHKIIISNNGDAIIGTHNGVAIFDGDTNWTIFTTQNSELPHGEVYCIAEENDGTIWFGTDGGGIGIYKSGSWNIYNDTNSDLLSNYIFELKVDNKGRMIIGSNQFIAFVKNDIWEVIPINEPSGEFLTISKITQENDTLFWLGSYEKGNVIKYEYGKGMNFFNPTNTIMSPYVDMITEIIVDTNYDKWISTCSGGVYKVSSMD